MYFTYTIHTYIFRILQRAVYLKGNRYQKSFAANESTSFAKEIFSPNSRDLLCSFIIVILPSMMVLRETGL